MKENICKEAGMKQPYVMTTTLEAFKASTSYKTLSRRQMLASTILWLVNLWSASQGDMDRCFLADDNPQEHPDSSGNISGPT